VNDPCLLLEARGRRELTALIRRAPKVAQLRVGDRLDEVPVEQVQVGDVIVVRTGEVVPVDGTVINPEAMIDTSTLSGELLPQTASRGMADRHPASSSPLSANAPSADPSDQWSRSAQYCSASASIFASRV
jgi:P-type E1-E2 ATPase